MLPIITNFGFLSTKILWSRFITKRITDFIISGKITENVGKVREKIRIWYFDYICNIKITIVLNLLIVGLAFFTYFFLKVNNIIVFVISAISIFMIIRTLYRFTKSIVKTIIPNWHNIYRYGRFFLKDIFGGSGLAGSIRDTIHYAFNNIYYGNTNGFTRGIHTVSSKLGFIKSKNEISKEIQWEFYSLITGYTVRVILYKVFAFIAWLAVFTFVLRPFVFSKMLNLNVFQVIVYPFTVSLPSIIAICKWVISQW